MKKKKAKKKMEHFAGGRHWPWTPPPPNVATATLRAIWTAPNQNIELGSGSNYKELRFLIVIVRAAIER